MSYFLQPNPHQSWTSTQTAFASRLVVNGPSVAGGELLLQPSDHSNSAGSIQFRQLASSGRYNWLVGLDVLTNNALDFIPSSAVDGSTFSTPVLRLTGVGAVSIGHASSTLGFFGVSTTTRAAAYTPTNVTTSRTFDADTVGAAGLADVVGTLIADLQAYGLLQ